MSEYIFRGQGDGERAKNLSITPGNELPNANCVPLIVYSSFQLWFSVMVHIFLF